MSKIEEVRAAMMAALKARDTPRKDSLSALLSALKAKEKDKGQPLTEAEENAVVQREVKQTQETMESAPESRTDIREECAARIAVLKAYMPAAMGEDEIRALIAATLEELGITEPTGKQKGLLMKALMPKVAGKADGGFVNRLVTQALAG